MAKALKVAAGALGVAALVIATGGIAAGLPLAGLLSTGIGTSVFTVSTMLLASTGESVAAPLRRIDP